MAIILARSRPSQRGPLPVVTQRRRARLGAIGDNHIEGVVFDGRTPMEALMLLRPTARSVATGCALLLTLTLAPGAPARAGSGPPGVPAQRAAALQAALDAVHAAGVPGVFAEVRDGAAVWRGTSGVADLTTGASLSPSFEHRIGSITKTFVSATVLRLAAQGRIGLDDPIGRYVGDLVPADLAAQVTIRMLLGHTSGINDYPLALFASPFEDIERYRTETVSPERLVELGLGLPRVAPPGALYFYSNTNYVLAGLIIERVTGHPVELEVARQIIVPLRLRHTYWPGSFPYIVGPHAHGYVPWNDGTLRDFTVYNMSWAWTAGAMISTMADLNTFFAALLTGRVVPAALLAQMRAVLPVDPADPTGTAYGLGLIRARTPCEPAWGHTGGGFGYGTTALRGESGNHELSVAYTLTLYPTGGTVDTAIVRFLLLALCGTTPAAPSSSAAPSLIALPR
jgi:D-alanyl-D-alanine carboxypeptidase